MPHPAEPRIDLSLRGWLLEREIDAPLHYGDHAKNSWYVVGPHGASADVRDGAYGATSSVEIARAVVRAADDAAERLRRQRLMVAAVGALVGSVAA